MVGGGLLVVGFSWDRSLDPIYGAVLLAGAAAYLAWDLLGILRSRQGSAGGAEPADAASGLAGAVAWFAVGGACVLAGSYLLVESGQGLAAALGVPSAIIGFSVIAVGTSLPELVTGVTAARKGVPDLSLGNIVGANVLNLLLIVGLSGTIQPLVLDPFSQWYGFPWLGIFFLTIVGVVLKHGVVRRAAGIGLLMLYALYVIGLVSVPALG